MKRAKHSQSLQGAPATTKKIVAGVAIVGGVTALALMLLRKRGESKQSKPPYYY